MKHGDSRDDRSRSGQRAWRVALAAGLALFAGASSVGAEDREKGAALHIESARKGRRTSARMAALEKLRNVRDPRSIREWRLVELMLELARDRSPRIAWKAVTVLGDYATGVDPAIASEARSPLVRIAGDADAHVIVRIEAVRVLGRTTRGARVEVDDVVVELVKLSSPSPDVRSWLAAEALKALARIGDPRGAEPIRKGLFHRDPVMREVAPEALRIAFDGPYAGEFLTPRTGEQLLSILARKDVPPEAREGVLRALGKAVEIGLKVPNAESTIVKLLSKEERPGTVTAALEALGSVGTARSAACLADLCKRFGPREGGKKPKAADGRDAVRAQVSATIGDLVERWGSERVSRGREAAAGTLLGILVSAVAHDESEDARIADVLVEAVIALGAFHGKCYDRIRPRAVDTLVAVAEAESAPESVRKEALDSLRILTGRRPSTCSGRRH